MKKIIRFGCAVVVAFACLVQVEAAGKKSVKHAGSTKSAPVAGRIEQTASPGSTLPAALTVLKAQTPKLDTTPRPSKMLTGGVTQLGSEVSEESYPSEMLGMWGGTLKLASVTRARPFRNPEERAGTPGMVVFNFVKDGSAVRLKPATIFLPGVTKPAKNVLFQPQRLERMKQRAKETGREINPNQMLDRNPVMKLGGGEFAKLGGETGSATLTANNLRGLGKGMIEQDIVFKYEHKSAQGDRLSGYGEFICRFKQNGPKSQFVQVAKIKYAPDGTMLRRVLFEGTVTRDWKQTADKISKQLDRPWERIVMMHDI